jgi:hypothetical protein
MQNYSSKFKIVYSRRATGGILIFELQLLTFHFEF